MLAGMRLFHGGLPDRELSLVFARTYQSWLVRDCTEGLNASFIRSLANITERKMNFLGDVFKDCCRGLQATVTCSKSVRSRAAQTARFDCWSLERCASR